MKYRSSFIPFFLICWMAVGCSHHPPVKKMELSEYSPEQMDELNREALVIASKRLEEMVIQAKSNQSTVNYLATDLFLKGNMSLMEGDYTTASVLFKHLVTLVPEDEFVQKKYAVSLIRIGDYEESQVVLEKLYSKTQDEKVGLILAGVYTGLDKEKLAKKVYTQILSSNPKNEDACVFLSKSLAVEKAYAKALAQLETCSRKDAQNGMYDYYAGKIYLEMGQLSKAMKSFEKATVRQPELGQAVSARGIILEEREQHESAIKVYKDYLVKQPNDTGILNRLVQVLFLKERYDEVIPYAERLGDLEPDNLNLKVKLGILYSDAKKYSEAISVFKDLLAAAPQSDKILYYLGAIHQEMSQYPESIDYFNQIPVESGLYTDSSVQMANMLSTLAQTDTKWKNKFIQFVNAKLSEMKDMRVEFSVIKSGFYESIGSYKEAMEAMMVVQDAPNFTTQHKYYLANLYEKEKKYEESTALILGIVEKEPKNAHAWNFLGYSLLMRSEGDIEKAYEYIQIALKISPDDGYIRDSLGWYYFKKGHYQKALAELEFAFKKVPEDVEILKHLAIIHKKMNDYTRAKGFLESALKLVRYQDDRNDIMSQMKELDGMRVPAASKLD